MFEPGANDRPHLTLFDSETGISFIWDTGTKIHVCPGGYGEPIVSEIETYVDLECLTVHEAYETLKTFVAAYCRGVLSVTNP